VDPTGQLRGSEPPDQPASYAAGHQSSPRRTSRTFGWIWSCGIGGYGKSRCSEHKICKISATGQDRAKITIDCLYKHILEVSIYAKMSDLEWPLSEIPDFVSGRPSRVKFILILLYSILSAMFLPLEVSNEKKLHAQCTFCIYRTLQQHRAVSLRQHSFLVKRTLVSFKRTFCKCTDIQ